jgi:hypothetical protein
MGQDTPTLAEIGDELIQLITETSESTGLSAAAIASVVVHTTGIKFNVQDGKLNITEDALKAMEWKMAYARAKCRALELPHKVSETTLAPICRSQVSSPKPAFVHPSERKPEAEPFNLIDAFFSVPWYAWIGGFVFILWVLAVTSPNAGNNTRASKPISAEDQLIKDAVTLQLRIERQEKEKQDKIEKEYLRQKREGR